MEFEAFWNRIAQPRWGKAQEGRVRAVWEEAKASVGCRLHDAVRWENPNLVSRLVTLRAVPKSSKQGKAMLRHALVQAAEIAVRSNPALGACYSKRLQGREQERGIGLKRLVKVAAKLLVIAWALMQREETFDPAKIQA